MEIFVNELPKSCKQCPYYEINSYADILGYKTNSHKCVLNGSMITGDCPLELISDRLAEERKRVVQEIWQEFEQRLIGKTKDMPVMKVANFIEFKHLK